MNFENDIISCLEVLQNGGLILYPTDTIWGIGCDATNEKAVDKIYKLKNRDDKKSMIILVSEEKMVHNYAVEPSKETFEYLSLTKKPTTVIYDFAKNIAQNLVSSDGTIAIRIVKEDFCKKLIDQFKKPIVSTSANISGELSPKNFIDITTQIKNGVDYVVQHRQDDIMYSRPSSIIKPGKDGKIEILRS